GAPPKGSGAAEPGHAHSRVRGHAAASGRIFGGLDLLTAARERLLDLPDLVERRQAEADDADAFCPRGKLRPRDPLACNLTRRHDSTRPCSLSNRCVLPGSGRKWRLSPTRGRKPGSTRAMAEAPASSKCSGRMPSTALPPAPFSRA